MTRRQVFIVPFVSAFIIAALAFVFAIGAIGAQETPPEPEGTPPEGLDVPEAPPELEGPYEIVADGLDNPRGLHFAPNGDLYIAEAGVGGQEPCVEGPEGGTVCYGNSGAITVVRDGEQRRIVMGLPSLADEGDGEMPPGSAASGAHDVAAVDEDHVFVLMGFGADPALRETFAPRGWNFGELLLLTPEGGWTAPVDVAGYEARENPDGGEIDSNPYSLLVIAEEEEGYVVDAGGNSLLRIDIDGEITTVAVFEGRMADAPEFLGMEPGAQIPMDSVPTTVAQGPDGALYVGELTGFPFPAGEARVYRVEPGQEPEVYAEGFTNIIDIAFDADGELVVLEIAANGLLSGDPTGALRRADGSVIADEGLIMPTSVAIGPDDGAYYVSNCGVCPGTGQVVRIEP